MAPRKDCYVYYAYHAGLVKIGVSRDPRSRIESLRLAAPLIELIGFEREIGSLEWVRHDEFASLRVGGEWFVATDALMSFAMNLPRHPTMFYRPLTGVAVKDNGFHDAWWDLTTDDLLPAK